MDPVPVLVVGAGPVGMVAALALAPGFMRTEAILDAFGVTEANWRDGGAQDRNFLESESPLFVGRAVAALAEDLNVLARSGQLLSSWQCSRDYGFTDYDGRRPDWGRLAIDFSVLPPPFVEVFRTGTELQLAWLNIVAANTQAFLAKIPTVPVAATSMKKAGSRARSPLRKSRTKTRRAV